MYRENVRIHKRIVYKLLDLRSSFIGTALHALFLEESVKTNQS